MMSKDILYKHNQTNKRWYTIAFVFICIVYFLASYFNFGYFHPDEHYQLIEFAGWKLGWNKPVDLAWEYRSLVRPTLQVWICIAWFKLSHFFGLTDPYILAFSLRLLTSFVALCSIHFFYRISSKFLDEKYHFVYYITCFLLWFIPMVSVRFSSETWSGLSFLFAFSIAIKPQQSRWSGFWIGFAMALAFLFRFQTGILVASIFLWLVLIKRTKFDFILKLLLSFIFVVQLGIWLDTLFYGEYVLTFWNYFKVNIIDGVASHFGISPWDTILSYLVEYTVWPIGALFVVLFLILIWKSPSSPFIWCVLPFIVVHAVIPHKEVRFLFPLVWYVPAILLLALQQVDIYLKRFPSIYTRRNYFLLLLVPLFVLNLVALVVATLKPAGYRQKAITKVLDDYYQGRPVKIIHTPYGNPYAPWPALKENFYRNERMEYIPIDYPYEVSNMKFLSFSDTTYLLSIRGYETLDYNKADINLTPVHLEIGILPEFMESWLGYYIGTHSTSGFKIYEINRDHDEK